MDEAAAVESAHGLIRFGPMGWKVQSELPNPVNFEAATALVTPDDVRGVAACGPDPRRHLKVARQFVDAGFDHPALLNVPTPTASSSSSPATSPSPSGPSTAPRSLMSYWVEGDQG
jgi:hypothetical protein